MATVLRGIVKLDTRSGVEPQSYKHVDQEFGLEVDQHVSVNTTLLNKNIG